MGLRKNYRSLTDVERDRFIQALRQVKSSGLIDEFANLHARHFNMGIHQSSHFLPWHREFILRFELALQQQHPDITLPYWDSTYDTSPSDPLWENGFLGQFNAAWNLRRRLGADTLPTSEAVELNQNRNSYDRFWRELEVDIHNPPHRWVGGIMAGVASPGDPVFYLHHCWIDLLWARWQLAHTAAPFVSSGPGLGLNDPLMEWPDRTPANVLDHRALGYWYDNAVVSSSVVELSIDPATNRWVAYDMTDATGAPLAAGDPVGYLGGVPRVVFRSADSHVVELSIDPATNRWVAYDMTDATGAPRVRGEPAGYSATVPRVLFRAE